MSLFVFSGCSDNATTPRNDAVASVEEDKITQTEDVANTAPQFTSVATTSVEENQLSAITLSARDDDNDSVTFSISDGDFSDFDINSSVGVVTFKVSPDYESKTSYTFVATASDGIDAVNQSVTINIVDVEETVVVEVNLTTNTAPIFTSLSTATVDENQFSAIALTATDAETDTLVFSLSGIDSKIFDINSLNGVVIFKTAPDFEIKDSYTFTATVSDSQLETNQSITIIINNIAEGTAQLGKLANAELKIFKVEDNGTTTLKWTETTSGGDTLAEIGRFPLHSEALVDDSLYIYQIIGGNDWDVDNDGFKDANLTINNGIIRSIIKGSDVKFLLDNFRITVISEILYQKLVLLLNDKNRLLDEQIKWAKELISDINGDGKIDYLDISSYNPVEHTLKENLFSKNDIQIIIDKIHNNESIIASVSSSNNKIVAEGNISSPASYDIVISSDGLKSYSLNNGDHSLQVINLENNSLSLLGEFDFTSINNNYSCYQLKISSDNSKAYVTCSSDNVYSLLVLNISDSNNIQHIGTYDGESSFLFDVELFDNDSKLFLTTISGVERIEVLDILDSTNITKISEYTVVDVWRTQVSQDETKLFVSAGTNGIKILDITNLNNITEISNIDVYGQTGIGGYASDLVLTTDENTLFASFTGNGRGLVSIDISDIQTPTISDSIIFDYIFSITLSNDETRLYCAGDDSGSEFYVVDVSNPNNLSVLSTVPARTQKVALSNDGSLGYYFTQNKFNAISLISLENYTIISTNRYFKYSVGDYKKSKLTNHIYITGSHVYTSGSGYNDLLKIFTTDGTILSEISSINLNSDTNRIVMSADENYLYLTGRGGNDDDGLYIVDISDKSNPQIISHFTEANFGPVDMILSEDQTKLYIAATGPRPQVSSYKWERKGAYFYALDISDKSNPSIITSITDTGNDNENAYSQQIYNWDGNIVLYKEKHISSSEVQIGFEIINMSDYSVLYDYTKNLQGYGRSEGIFINQNTSELLFYYDAHIDVFDLTDLDNLTIQQTFYISGTPSSMIFKNNHILVGTASGIDRIDINNGVYSKTMNMPVYRGMEKMELLEDNIAIGGGQTNIVDISQINY